MKSLLTSGFAAALLLTSVAAEAQHPQHPPQRYCGNIKEIAGQLAVEYGEVPVAAGLQSNGELFQIYASDKTGTWTAVVVHPSGRACVAVAGENWQATSPGTPTGFTPIEDAHPSADALDPYEGYTRSNGETSCCGGRDCQPASFDDELGLIQLPRGDWVDPLTHINEDRTEPAVYFSFDGRAHVCISAGKLVCAFIPGQGA